MIRLKNILESISKIVYTISPDGKVYTSIAHLDIILTNPDLLNIAIKKYGSKDEVKRMVDENVSELYEIFFSEGYVRAAIVDSDILYLEFCKLSNQVKMKLMELLHKHNVKEVNIDIVDKEYNQLKNIDITADEFLDKYL